MHRWCVPFLRQFLNSHLCTAMQKGESLAAVNFDAIELLLSIGYKV
jgi:hypothetical protein